MDFKKLLAQFDQVSAADGVMVSNILRFYPSSGSDAEESILFATLLKFHIHLQQGNTCLPLHKIADKLVFASASVELAYLDAGEHANTPEDENTKAGIVLPNISELRSLIKQWIESQTEVFPYLLEEDELRLHRYYRYETEIAHNISQINRKLDVEPSSKLLQVFQYLFPNKTSIDWQAIAVASALNQGLMILNGGPGTGKTHTLARMLIMLQMQFPNKIVKLAAPTGKAAQRLHESLSKTFAKLASTEHLSLAHIISQIPMDTTTLHKLIGTHVGKTTSTKNEQKKLGCDILVIDEFSMVDVALFAKTLRACKAGVQLILVGDTQQLPSVEAGNILKDLSHTAGMQKSEGMLKFIAQLTGHNLEGNMASGADHIVTLYKNHRSEQNVSAMADAVQQGDITLLSNLLNQQSDAAPSAQTGNSLYADDCDEEQFRLGLEGKLATLVTHYQHAIDAAPTPQVLLSALNEYRVLTPIRKGRYGVQGLNYFIAQQLARHKVSGFNTPIQAFHGQAIIINENDYSVGLSNGDIGVVWDNNKGTNSPPELVAFIEKDDKKVKQVSLNRLPKYETAFALTIHKTQGSEYEQVLLVLPFGGAQACTQELLYTGITRAQKSVDILAVHCVLNASLKRSNQRDTCLANLLKQAAVNVP